MTARKPIPRKSAPLPREARPFSAAELIELRQLLCRERGSLVPHLSPAEVAKLLGLSSRAIANLVRQGEFPGASRPIPNRVLIPVTDVHAWLARHSIGRIARRKS